jgi:flagellar hook assembly protein FlgD
MQTVDKSVRVEITASEAIGTATATFGETSIHAAKPNSKKHGILLDKNPITADFAEIFVKTPEKAEINIAIYDNAGNVVFVGAIPRGSPIAWDLRNKNGRKVANGSYLVIAEATGASGKIYQYSAKIGIKR